MQSPDYRISQSIIRSPDHPITRFQQTFVWVGGALFAGALAFCAYSYLVAWARPIGPALVPAGAMLRNLALFAVFAAHHSVFARDGVKTWLARVVPPNVRRSVYVWTASLLLIVVCAMWSPAGGDAFDVSGPRAFLHAAVQLAGIGLIASSVRAIDALELAGIRRPSGGGTLQIAGPYRFVRHPLYLGWLLAMFGAAHMTIARLTFAIVSSLYLVIAVPWEERSLAREFPGEYAAYARRVRWRVVPYVY